MVDLQLPLFVALVFLIVSSPAVYRLTDKAGSAVGMRLADSTGSPTKTGMVAHAVVMFAVTYAYLKGMQRS